MSFFRGSLSIIVLLAVGGSAGCSKDGAVLSFITENDAFASALEAKAKSGGPTAARSHFDSNKDSLKKKFDSIKGARGFQVKKESMKKLSDSVSSSVITVCGLQMLDLMNPASTAAYKSICDDYTSLLGESPSSVPSVGDKGSVKTAAAGPSGPPPKVDLKTILGSKKDGWAPKVFSKLKAGMLPEEVGKMFPGAEDTGQFGIVHVKTKDEGIEDYQFSFLDTQKKGTRTLYSATINFAPAASTPAFYDELVKAATEKYGATKPADVAKKLVTWVGPGFITAQLSQDPIDKGYQLNVSLPKK